MQNYILKNCLIIAALALAINFNSATTTAQKTTRLRFSRNNKADIGSINKYGNQESFLFVESPDGSGSAFLADLHGELVIITNAHVYLQMTAPVIKDVNNHEYKITEIYVSKSRDLAILNFEGDKTKIKGLKISPNIVNLTHNSSISAVGNSLGDGVLNICNGKLLGIGPEKIEIDAPIVGGNSGGPVFAVDQNEVIGVSTYLRYVKNTLSQVGSRFNNNTEQVVRRFATRIDNLEDSDIERITEEQRKLDAEVLAETEKNLLECLKELEKINSEFIKNKSVIDEQLSILNGMKIKSHEFSSVYMTQEAKNYKSLFNSLIDLMTNVNKFTSDMDVLKETREKINQIQYEINHKQFLPERLQEIQNMAIMAHEFKSETTKATAEDYKTSLASMYDIIKEQLLIYLIFEENKANYTTQTIKPILVKCYFCSGLGKIQDIEINPDYHPNTVSNPYISTYRTCPKCDGEKQNVFRQGVEAIMPNSKFMSTLRKNIKPVDSKFSGLELGISREKIENSETFFNNRRNIRGRIATKTGEKVIYNGNNLHKKIELTILEYDFGILTSISLYWGMNRDKSNDKSFVYFRIERDDYNRRNVMGGSNGPAGGGNYRSIQEEQQRQVFARRFKEVPDSKSYEITVESIEYEKQIPIGTMGQRLLTSDDAIMITAKHPLKQQIDNIKF